MTDPASLPVDINISGHLIRLSQPDQSAIRMKYESGLAADPATDFPYWSKVWPASKAMAEFIAAHPETVVGKMVLELAAGLALPSLVAARWADKVIASDYLPEAVQHIQVSATLNRYTNMEARLINWNDLPAGLVPDVLLLSDVNYEPGVFPELQQVILNYLRHGTTILLSTPQRLMAKPFVEAILPYCRLQENLTVKEGPAETEVSLFVLR